MLDSRLHQLGGETLLPGDDMPLVLLVDDDDDVRAAFSQALRRRGHQVAEASDGSEALKLLLEAGLRPSLIVLDNDMPNLDGGGFREAQLAEPAIARIPVLLVTGDEEIEALAGALHPVGIVQKPVGFSAFLATVDLVFQRLGTAPAPAIA